MSWELAVAAVVGVLGGGGGLSAWIANRRDSKTNHYKALAERVAALESTAATQDLQIQLHNIRLSKTIIYLREVLAKALPYEEHWGPAPVPPEELADDLNDLIGVT